MQTEALLVQLRILHPKLVGVLRGLSEDQQRRTGVHPLLGEMDVLLWLEFFPSHEGHHLYAILFRLREPSKAQSTQSPAELPTHSRSRL